MKSRVKMLAIFDGSVVKRPESMKVPHRESVSALKDGFLVDHFISVYPNSAIISIDPSATFAYSLECSGTGSTTLPRVQFCHRDNIFCMYQGYMQEIDNCKKAYRLNEVGNEPDIIIQAFQILRQYGRKSPRKVVEDMSGNFISFLYEVSSKFILLSGDSYGYFPLFWGIDARFSLVLSDDATIVEKACHSSLPFPSGEVYISCQGHTGLQALFTNRQKPTRQKLDTVDWKARREKLHEMILQEDMEMRKSPVERWCPPIPNFVKINTAGVLISDGEYCGVGLIIRNSKGEIEVASSKSLKSPKFPFHVQMMALTAGISKAMSHGYQHVIAETEYLNIESCKEAMESDYIDSFVNSIATLGTKFTGFTISFVSSAANRAAQCLAENANVDRHVEWEWGIPECISSIVESECGVSHQ